MALEIGLMTLLPLVLYVVVDLKYGMKAGIATAVITGLAAAGWYYFKTGEIDVLLCVEIAFLLGLGVLSIQLNNSKFFKFQPTIIGVLVAGYVAYMHFFVEPVLIHYARTIAKMYPEYEAQFQDPFILRLFAMASWHVILLLLATSAFCAYTAVKKNNWWWIAARLSIYPGIVLLAMVDSLWARLVW